MEMLQIISTCLLVSSVIVVAYVSFNNYFATRNIDKNHFKEMDTV